MEIFKPKIIGEYPTENFFRKKSTLENIVTGDEGKKSSDKKKISLIEQAVVF